MPNQFLFEEGPFNVANDIEESFATDYWLFEQYIGDQLFSWGRGNFGQLGNFSITNRSTPVQERTSSTNWKQVSAGGYHTAAIKTNGTLWSWGFNDQGQIGDNTSSGGVSGTNSRSTPVQEFTSSTNWKQVSTLSYSTTAIKTDGTLWSWGLNSNGQIGDNTNGGGGLGANTSRSTPRQEITSSTNWKSVAGGSQHVVAIKTDGTLWCWGLNTTGQLGDNTLASRSTPRQEITSSTNWKQISAGSGGRFTAALKTDGTLWSWGYNSYGNIGDNTAANTIARSTPRQEFTSSTNWRQVFAASGEQTLAIKTNGTLWSWGRNNSGQIGDNTIANRSTPRQEITSSTNWKYVSGGYTTTAIKTDGTLWVWGINVHGQVGDNTNASRSTPRQEFTSSSNWKQISGGFFHTTAIKTGINIDTGIPTN
jgi:alpha-tubulin suppressor-like RCC1 family protein